MEINLVVLNLGNSRLAVAPFLAGDLGEVVRVPVSETGQWEEQIAEAWNQIERRENAAIVAASVNPQLDKVLEDAVMAAADRHIVWVGRDLDLPIKVLTDQPEQTGVDRVLNVAAAYEQLGKACVVVDAGTAVTISACNGQGEFLGGAIAPGVRLQLEALHEKTGALPLIPSSDLTVPADVLGRNTRDAMLQGIFHGIRGMVRDVVENFATELGSWPEAIATGGDAHLLFDGWDVIHAISPDLTLYGIALAYAEHHIKHGT